MALLLFAGALAAAVERFAKPLDGAPRVRADGAHEGAAVLTGPQRYPREAIDSDLFRVSLPRAPRRIVSQYWSMDEYLYSIVPPERVVAVSQSAYAPSLSNVYDLVQRYHPVIATDPERVLRLNPDLMMVSNTSRADFCALVRFANVPIYRVATMITTLDQIVDTIRMTGYLTGEDEAAARQATLFRAEIDHAKARRRTNMKAPRILGIAGVYSYGSDTLFDDIAHFLGAVNVAAEGGLKGYDQVNSEQVVRWNPEWIIAGAEPGHEKQELKTIMADPGIALTQAARSGHILVFDYRTFLPMSPFASRFVTALSEALYG